MSKDESNIVTLRISKLEAISIAKLIEVEMDEAKTFGHSILNIKALDKLWTAIDIAIGGPQAREEATKQFADKVKAADTAIFKNSVSVLDVAVPHEVRPDNASILANASQEAV